MITGESMPVTKRPGDAVVGSTINKTGSFTYRATTVGADTLLAHIVELVRRAQSSRAPIQKLVDTIANIFVPVVIILAIVTFVVWYALLGASVATALLYAVSVPEVLHYAKATVNSTGDTFAFIVAAAIYLVFNVIVTFFLKKTEKKLEY